ncbi:MAG TPA: DUF1554 domain-containing protein [Candidatus Binatia bacterium]|nr:DUF1554 domain-containing protein [Candidatus Binatia bacterium]
MKTFAGLVSSVLLLSCVDGASAQQTKDQQKCLNQMNGAGIKLAAQAAGVTRGCMAAYSAIGSGGEGGPSAEACIAADAKGKIAKAQAKVAGAADKHCTTEYPTIAEHAGPDSHAAAVSAAATAAVADLHHDLFGRSLDTGLFCENGDDACKCRGQIATQAGKLTSAMGKVWLACKKSMLSEKGPVPGGATSDSDIAACLTGSAADPDTAGSSVHENSVGADSTIGAVVAKLQDKAADVCASLTRDPFDGDGATGDSVGSDTDCAGFAGPTGSENWAAFASCVEVRARCRFCSMVNAFDNLTVDCDLFDDGADNGTCGQCTQPADPVGGSYEDCDPTGNGGTCALTCHPGYVLAPSGNGQNECASGNWSDDEHCQAALYVFVTSVEMTNGNLGGLAGADTRCKNRAEASSLTNLHGRQWAAWLSTSSVDAKNRVENLPYVLVDGTTVVAHDLFDLIDGTLDNGISKTELGTTVTNAFVYTGTLSNGRKYYDELETCDDWTYSAHTSPPVAWRGTSGASDATWTDDTATACDTPNRLYCFEVIP